MNEYHLEIGEEGTESDNQGTSGIVEVGWQKTGLLISKTRGKPLAWDVTTPDTFVNSYIGFLETRQREQNAD